MFCEEIYKSFFGDISKLSRSLLYYTPKQLTILVATDKQFKKFVEDIHKN
jgi:hypothetical protein